MDTFQERAAYATLCREQAEHYRKMMELAHGALRRARGVPSKHARQLAYSAAMREYEAAAKVAREAAEAVGEEEN